ncbi:MAG: hypothetical protein LUF87_02155 [Alistipes sp.]|nr:hypothetical protein [Alistipes sp.]
MSQEVRTIRLKDLVLWTENPRDPINPNATDQQIVDKAIRDHNDKWTLKKLAKEMGDYYDFSELPTVVYHGKKPVVYDGNRRIILGKIQHGYVDIAEDSDIDTLPNIPKEIPCNVCSEDIALKNVYRKHADSGSWSALERDMFVDKFMSQGKSTFLLFDENTGGMISNNSFLNQRFVKEEVLTEHILHDLGFEFKDGQLYSKYTPEQATEILTDLAHKIQYKEITTRKNRGTVKKALEPTTISIIEDNYKNKFVPIDLKSVPEKTFQPEVKKRKTKRVSGNKLTIFGGPLYLVAGEVSNLYRDILDLNSYYEANKKTLSNSFPCLIRMSMRLFCETAAQERTGGDMDKYIKANFKKAKATLKENQDAKTYLSSHNVAESSLLQHLHIGAHNYTASKNYDQTIAISIILGAMVQITHGKN